MASPLPRKVGKVGSGLSGDLARHAGLGLHFAATLLVFAGIGYGLDRWLDTAPWLLLGGVFTGFVGGTISMVRRVFPPRAARAGREARRDDATSDEQTPTRP